MKHEWIQIAVEAAEKAAEAIMTIYDTDFEVRLKDDKSPVTTADQASSDILIAALNKTNLPIISEEEAQPPFEERSKASYVWIVDPLDGTKEFIRKNGEFCICIALVKNGIPYFGLIAAPVAQKIMLGSKEMGTFYFDFGEKDYLNKRFQLPTVMGQEVSTVAYSRSHLSNATKQFLNDIEAGHEFSFIRKGSALKFLDLALNHAQLYPRTAPTMEWDIAAGHAIYEGVGGEVLDFTTFEPLKYNKENLYNPYFIAKPAQIIFEK